MLGCRHASAPGSTLMPGPMLISGSTPMPVSTPMPGFVSTPGSAVCFTWELYDHYARQESTDRVYHRLVTNKVKRIPGDETCPLRPECDDKHAHRTDRCRIPRGKTARYLQSLIPTVIRTHTRQAGKFKHSTQRLEMRVRDEAGVKWRNDWE